MPSQQIDSSVVVVARQFNPSVFSQLWLVRNHVVDEGSFVKGCLYTDEVAKVETRLFGLLVIPPQLQFQPRVAPEEEAGLIRDKVGSIIRLLPHTPFTAVGLNFAWHLWPDNQDLPSFSRSLFLRSSGPFFEAFGDAGDSLFGAYVSRDFQGCRLRLDIKPIEGPFSENQVVRRRLHFGFNFQLDVPQEDPIPAMEQHLDRWKQAKDEATRIVKLVEGYAGEHT